MQCLICKQNIEALEEDLEDESSTEVTYEVVHLKCLTNLLAYKEEMDATRLVSSTSKKRP